MRKTNTVDLNAHHLIQQLNPIFQNPSRIKSNYYNLPPFFFFSLYNYMIIVITINLSDTTYTTYIEQITLLVWQSLQSSKNNNSANKNCVNISHYIISVIIIVIQLLYFSVRIIPIFLHLMDVFRFLSLSLRFMHYLLLLVKTEKLKKISKPWNFLTFTLFLSRCGLTVKT